MGIRQEIGKWEIIDKIYFICKNILKPFIFYISLFFLLLFGIYLIFQIHNSGQIDSLTLLSGLSTYAVALFTLIYVYSSTKQVEVMVAQVDEMKKDRVFQSQPLLAINNLQITIEIPQLWAIPPFRNYSIHSQYNVNFKLRNIGLHPAVGIGYVGFIKIVNSNFCLESSSRRISVLPSEMTRDERIECVTSIIMDRENSILTNLLPYEGTDLIIFELKMVYKNILGGSFLKTLKYALFVEEQESRDIINNWLSQIAAFKIKHKPDFDTIAQLPLDQDDVRRRIIASLEPELKEKLSGKEIVVDLFLIPDATKIKILTSEEYTKELREMKSTLHPRGLFKSGTCDENIARIRALSEND